MRIIGGEARGRKIRLPAGRQVRPTADRVKESLFNILNPIEEMAFLDLFAGSGSVGLEALSRGARFSVFVEKDIRLANLIKMSLDQFGFENRADIIAMDAERALECLTQKGKRFDVVFADPPYDRGLVKRVFGWLEKADILDENGIIVIQHSLREMPEGLNPREILFVDRRRYGDTMVSFLKKTRGKKHEEDSGISRLV